jgi:hypothetical protein
MEDDCLYGKTPFGGATLSYEELVELEEMRLPSTMPTERTVRDWNPPRGLIYPNAIPAALPYYLCTVNTELMKESGNRYIEGSKDRRHG